MSLLGFQQALSELVMKPALKKRVAAGEEDALAGYDLSTRERRRIVALARDRGIKTGTTIHRSFRLSMLANTLPRTLKALAPEELKLLVQEYWSLYLPRSLQYVPEAQRFAEFALERVRGGAIQNPFAEEVLETELAILSLAGSLAWHEPGAGNTQAAGAGAPDSLRLHPLCRVVRFRHEPAALLAALASGPPPAGMEEGEHYLVLVARGSSQVDFRPLPRDLGRGLAACAAAAAGKGSKAVAVADLPERTGLPAEDCAAVAAELVRAGWAVAGS